MTKSFFFHSNILLSTFSPRPLLQSARSSLRFSLIALTALLLLLGCGSGRKAQKPLNLKERSSAYLLRKLNNNQIKADWLSARARVTFSSPEETRHFTSYIRLQRDSLIWMNFKKNSIEAARVLITPDSFFLINRLDNEYAAKSLDFIINRLALPFGEMDGLSPFQALQALMLGNPVFMPVKSMNSRVDESRYHLFGENRELKSHYYLNGADYSLHQISFLDSKYQRQVQFLFEEYEPLDKADKFSYFRIINVDTPENGRISFEMNLNKVELNTPKNIQFEIPSHYTKID